MTVFQKRLGVILFPIVTLSLTIVLLHGLGHALSTDDVGDDESRNILAEVGNAIVGIAVMMILYSISLFRFTQPTRANVGKATWVVWVAIVLSAIAGAGIEELVSNVFHWTESPQWIAPNRFRKGMFIVILTGWWLFREKNPSGN